MNTLSRALELVVVLVTGAIALHVTCMPGAEVLGRMAGCVAWALVGVLEGF